MGSQRNKKAKTKAKNAKAAPDNRNRNILLAVGGVLGVAILGYLLWLALQPQADIAGVVNFPRPSRGHEANLDIPFGDRPPAGGTHDPRWQNCGVYDNPINTANGIHSMEHGAVWITYQPDLPPDQIADIQDRFRGQTFFLVSPYPEQVSPIVLTAWDVQLDVDSLEDERVGEFVERYRLGPNTPERGASCTGNVGDPS